MGVGVGVGVSVNVGVGVVVGVLEAMRVGVDVGVGEQAGPSTSLFSTGHWRPAPRASLAIGRVRMTVEPHGMVDESGQGPRTQSSSDEVETFSGLLIC